MSLGALFRKIRLERQKEDHERWTTAEVARRLFIHFSTLTRLEQGIIESKPAVLKKLAREFDLDEEYVLIRAYVERAPDEIRDTLWLLTIDWLNENGPCIGTP